MPCSTVLRAGRLALLVALAIPLVPPPPAEARSRQVRAKRAASVASRQARTDAIAPPEDPAGGFGLGTSAPPPAANAPPEAPPLAWSIDLLLPALWNSDPEQTAGGIPSPEFTPEARLTWNRRLDSAPVRLSAVADASTDRFTRARDADADLLYGRLRAQYESGTDDQEWQPFVSYVPTLTFAPFYARRTDTWHDFALGAAKSWEWDGGLGRVPRGEDTEAAATWTFAVNFAAQRRERDGGPPSSALLFNPSVTWTVSATWNASLEVDLTRRWYDRFDGRRRQDWLAVPIVTVEYQVPEGWLPPQESRLGRAIGAPVLDLQVYLTRQSSSLEEGRFHQWGAGPILRTAWKF